MTPEQMRRSGHLRIFVSYYRPHLAIFLLDMVCALGICLVDLLFPMVSRHALNELLPRSLYGAFFALMTVLLLAYVLKGVFTFIVTYWGHLLGVRIEADIRSDLFSHMQDLSFSFYDKNRTGQLMSRVTGDLFEITELAHHGPEDLFISVVTLTGAFCVMLTIRWELALIVFAVVPLFILFTVRQRKRMMEASSEVKRKLEQKHTSSYVEQCRDYVQKHYPQIKVVNIALPDAYVEHGNVSVLRNELGIDSDSIIQRLKTENWLSMVKPKDRSADQTDAQKGN